MLQIEPAGRETSRDSKRIPYSADKRTGYPGNQAAGQSANSNAHGFGARVSRRAADRLRAGHVWVYASDVESLKLGAGDAPGSAAGGRQPRIAAGDGALQPNIADRSAGGFA